MNLGIVCNEEFTSDKDSIIQCEYCLQYYCSQCLNISSSEYEHFHMPSLHWFRPSCEGKVMKNLKSDREVEARCSEFLQKMEDRINRLKEEMKTKATEQQVKDIIKNQM